MHILFQLEKSRKGFIARAVETENGGLRILKGSHAAKKWETSNVSLAREEHRRLYEKLKEDGVLLQSAECDFLVFSRDWEATSFNEAADVVNGRPSSGRQEWKDCGLLKGETE